MGATSLKLKSFDYEAVIDEIGALNWRGLDEAAMINAAWAYYFFSVQFQENMETAIAQAPDDQNLRSLEREESNTDNLSPWPGVAAEGERMNHCEFMRRLLTLSPIPEGQRRDFERYGANYLRINRSLPAAIRALSISSYEDGGLERTFKAMLRMPESDNPALLGFKHFLSSHIAFDSDPVKGHGALTRHLRPDDTILPCWTAFRDILVAFVPQLVASIH